MSDGGGIGESLGGSIDVGALRSIACPCTMPDRRQSTTHPARLPHERQPVLRPPLQRIRRPPDAVRVEPVNV